MHCYRKRANPGCAVLTLAIVTAMPAIAAAQSVSTIVYSRLNGESTEIWRIDADGSNHKRIGPGFEATGSPDGRWIAFAADRDRDDPEIYLANAVDGSNQQRLTYTRALDEVPSWSPDGSKILFSSDMHDEPQSGTYDIYIMNVDGSEQRRLTHTPGAASYPSMSADGSTIAYSYQTGEDTPARIWLIDADGSNPRLLLEGGGIPRFAPRRD